MHCMNCGAVIPPTVKGINCQPCQDAVKKSGERMHSDYCMDCGETKPRTSGFVRCADCQKKHQERKRTLL